MRRCDPRSYARLRQKGKQQAPLWPEPLRYDFERAAAIDQVGTTGCPFNPRGGKVEVTQHGQPPQGLSGRQSTRRRKMNVHKRLALATAAAALSIGLAGTAPTQAAERPSAAVQAASGFQNWSC